MKKGNKWVGGPERAQEAREGMERIMKDEKHPLHFAKDIEFAREFDVSRHTIYRIREELGMLPRLERVVTKLRSIDLSRYTIKDLTILLNVKYQGLYKIIEDHKFSVKPDVPPIEALKRYQKARKKRAK